MKPAPLDLEIYKGDTCEVFFRLRAKNTDGTAGAYINLTGCTPKAQIRATSVALPVIAEFVATLSDQNTVPGGVLLKLSPATTAAIVATSGVWDAQITNAATDVSTYLAGTVTFTSDVTHV